MIVIDEKPNNDICYRYFILKNGARLTSFRVDSAKIDVNVEDFINSALKLYPEDAEMYEITEEEHLLLHKINATRRRLFKSVRKRNTKLIDGLNQDILANVSNFIDG